MNSKNFGNFRTWLESLRDQVAQPLILAERELAPLYQRVEAIDTQVSKLSAHIATCSTLSRERAKFLQGMCLGFLRVIAPIRKWLELDTSAARSRMQELVREKSGLMHKIKEKYVPLDHLQPSVRAWAMSTAQFTSFVQNEWDGIWSIPEVKQVETVEGWLKISLHEILCFVEDDFDGAYQLGELAIFLKPEIPLVVRRKGGPLRAADGILWHAPHIQEGKACFGTNGPIYAKCLQAGKISELLRLLVPTLKVASNDAWGTPIIRLFPRVSSKVKVA